MSTKPSKEYDEALISLYKLTTFQDAQSIITEINPYFKQAAANATELINCKPYLDSLNSEKLLLITRTAKDLSQELEHAQGFINEEHFASQLESAKRKTRRAVTNAYQSFQDSVILPFVRFKDEMDLLSRIEETKGKVDQILTSARAAVGEVGAYSFVDIFDDQSKWHFGVSLCWLVVTATTTVFVFWWLQNIFLKFTEELSKNHESSAIIIQLLLSKLIIISLLSYILFQFFKNVNAHQHLSTLNKHRANILRAYHSLMDAAHDPATRDVILLQTTLAIYDGGDTGFISGKDSAKKPYDLSHLLELLKRS